MFSQAFFGLGMKNGLDKVRAEGHHAKIQIKLNHGLCNQGVHI